MIGSLSAFSPGSFQSYGGPPATATSLANDGSAVCSSLDCGVHGALNRAQLQAQFPGLTILGGEPAQQPGKDGTQTRRPVGGATSSQGLSSGETLLGAQQQASQTNTGNAKGAGDLSEEERDQVAKLKQIDAKVRAHERAHAAVGGQYAGAPSYSYTRGPDGQLYAVGGEVSIDISAESDPQATLQKATQVAAAALAPADPSGQDRAVAAAAAQLRLQALAQIREEKRAEDEQAATERTAAKEAEEVRKADEKNQARPDEPALPGGPDLGGTPLLPGQATADGRPKAEADKSVGAAAPASDGPASRAAQAYAQTAGQVAGGGANDNIAAAGRRLGQLVGLIA